jgi:phosphoglycerol transferase MdoB-like AlkP superfamily enzyme
MKSPFTSPRVSLFSIAVITLWLKTYIAYKVNFEIDIENWRQ